MVSVVDVSPKEQIICAAERLFAERGLDVSLRDIGAAAGNGNNSAVQYHFGSKERLVRAVIEYRMPRIHDRRALLVAELRPNDIRSWLECVFRPILEQSELDGSHHLNYVAMLRQHGRRDVFEDLPSEYTDHTRDLHDRVMALLPHLPEPLRAHRVAQAMALVVSVGADREQARARGDVMLPLAVQLADLLDATVGFLEAPASPRTLALLDADTSVSVGWLRFL